MSILAALVLSIGMQTPSQKEWVSLFDGKTLEGWTAKIKGHDLGDNFANTFRVVDGKIQVSYDGYGGKFEGRFGHLFYKSPYSDYMLRLEYRFIGKQLPDGPGWAYKNSGIMIHGQDPKTMGKDQDFPVSAEVQLLGGDDTGERHTGNLCTPGTNVVMDGKLVLQHCFDSTSPTFRGEVWVKVEVEAHGNGTIIHRIDGKEVIRYEKVQLDDRDADAKKLIKDGNLMVSGGSISLQSESHPVEFRNIEIRKL
jgi:hypothetical protein